MLHTIAELAEHSVRNVSRMLRDVEHADALRADQSRDLLDLVAHRVARIVEQEMRLVEEEHELRLRQIAHFRQ